METAEIIRNSNTKGEWVVSIDMKDAYFYIPIHKESHHLLPFHVDGQTYQFKALPFRLATTPLEFTRVAREAKLILQSREIRVHQYLDDWLLRANTRHQCQLQTKKLIHTLQQLGFTTNFEKYELRPTQKIDFLGYHFDLVQGKVFPTEKKLKILEKLVQGMDLITNYPKTVNVPDTCVSISRKDNTNGQAPHASLPVVGCPLHPEEQNTLIFTDASNQGWVAYLENMTVSRNRTNQEKSLHINVLEIKAVFLSLKSFQTTF